MDKEKWLALEFESLRGELNNRINFLHNTINLAVIFWLIFLITGFVFVTLGIDQTFFYTYLLLIPIVLDLLAFNYQSNQNSLESIARYYQYQLKPIIEKERDSDVLGWEKFFANDKIPYRFESVTKIFPFVLPSVIAFYFLFAKIPLTNYQLAILIIDLLFLALMLITFRYKLRRVK